VRRLDKSSRIADLISVSVIARTFPVSKVHAVLAATGKASIRQRNLPAHVVVYCVIALALYMNASCREVLRCLLKASSGCSTRARRCARPASRASRKPERVSARRPCVACMMRWSGPSTSRRLRVNRR
jgi:hypothetical protein